MSVVASLSRAAPLPPSRATPPHNAMNRVACKQYYKADGPVHYSGVGVD